MIAPKIHTTSFDGHNAQYVLFSNTTHFDSFVKKRQQQLSAKNTSVLERLDWETNRKIKEGSAWYGLPTPESVAELASHDRYTEMSLIKSLEQKVRRKLRTQLLELQEQQLKIPALQVNSKGLGVFSFAHAAMGLYRLQPSATHPPLQGLLTQLRIISDTGNKATSIRSSFLHFENNATMLPSVDLYIMAGANSTKDADELRYIGLGAAVLAQYLEQHGIAVQIQVVLGTYFDQTLHTAIIKIKGYADPLDLNKLLLVSSDPRYFRYRGIKGLICLSDYLGKRIPLGLGTIKKAIGKSFITDLQPKAVLFENSYSMHSAVQEITRILSNHIKN